MFSIALCFLICLGAAACGPSSDNPKDPSDNEDPIEQEIPLDTAHGIADTSKLYGICYLIEDREYWGTPFKNEDFAIDFQLIKNLGAKTVRHWMHFNYLLNDKNTLNEKNCATMHAELAESNKHVSYCLTKVSDNSNIVQCIILIERMNIQNVAYCFPRARACEQHVCF